MNSPGRQVDSSAGLWGNPVFQYEFLRIRRDPRKTFLILLIVLAGVIVGVSLTGSLLLGASDASRSSLPQQIRQSIFWFVYNVHYFLPLIPISLFALRMDELVHSGYLTDLALTPLKTEDLLRGWLGAWLLWGALIIGVISVTVVAIIVPSLYDSSWSDVAYLVLEDVRLLDALGALLAGLPFALYLSLAHRRRAGVILMSVAFVTGISFLLQNTAYILHVLTSRSFWNRDPWMVQFIRSSLALGLFGGMGLLFLMKAGAQLSGYFAERLEPGRGRLWSGAPWFRSPMTRLMWGERLSRCPWRRVVYAGLLVAIVASGLAWLIGNPYSARVPPEFDLIHAAMTPLIFWPAVACSVRELPRLWNFALRNMMNEPSDTSSARQTVPALTVFKAIYYPLFHLNMGSALLASGASFAVAYWVAGTGFFRAYHYALLLPISAFLTLMTTQLYGTYASLQAGPDQTSGVGRRMTRLLGAGLLVMAITGWMISTMVMRSPNTISIWAWMLTFSLTAVFPLAAWLNMKIERQLRGMRFAMPDPTDANLTTHHTEGASI